ncbi:latrophilin-like protein LAT-2 [Dysidea avara]|uniref:latrophilin-like protein LAT-2 n=1 Tax=Dysidea avara TaxID=196820 RepID=UPI0033208CA2
MAKYLIKATILLLPIFGLTWLIGIISVNAETSAFAWIFAILNTLQGAFILFFHVLRNQEVKSRLFSVIGRVYRPGSRYSHSSRALSTRTTHSLKKSARNDTFTFNQLASPTSCNSATFGEKYLTTTLDKNKQKNQVPSEQTNDGDEKAKKADSNCEVSATNPLAAKKDLDTVSEAGTIKDSDSTWG